MNPPTPTQLPATGAMLRGMRESLGLTLADLAARARTTKPTLSRFERGERTVSPELLARITRALADASSEKRRGDAA